MWINWGLNGHPAYAAADVMSQTHKTQCQVNVAQEILCTSRIFQGGAAVQKNLLCSAKTKNWRFDEE